jgi:hypothetical protein
MGTIFASLLPDLFVSYPQSEGRYYLIFEKKSFLPFLLTVHVFNEMCIAASNRVEYSEKERE